MSRCVELPSAGRPSAGLSALQQYGDSGSDSEVDMDVDVERLADKRRCSSTTPPAQKRRKATLPLPASVAGMFGAGEHVDAPELHQGRQRSFAHVRGNWPTYVFLPFEDSPMLQSLVQTCLAICEPVVPLTAQSQPHISLTRTVVLKHHWIQAFLQAARLAVSAQSRFQLSLGPARVYVNEERSRTFLGLTVAAGAADTARASRALDCCLAEFGLPGFYEEGSFHLSLAWCVGDRREALERLLPQVDTAVVEFAALSPLVCDVTELHCCCGNRQHPLRLAGGSA